MDYLNYYERLQYVRQSIAFERINSPQSFADQLRCSEKTIRNMINKLRENGDEIVYCKKTRKYLLKE